jgi:hypothetical protein
MLCTSDGHIAAPGRLRLPSFPCRCSCCSATRSSLVNAGAPRLSASAGVASVRPASESLLLLSCVLTGVGRLASVSWQVALAPYPASDIVSARGRRRGSGPPVHLNPLHGSLSMRSPPLPLLQLPAPLVYPSFVSSRASFLFCFLF